VRVSFRGIPATGAGSSYHCGIMYDAKRRPFCCAALFVLFLPAATFAAGDVTSKVKGDNLILKGDELNNVLEITGSGGDVVVRGLDGTLIDGRSTVVFDGIDRDIRVKLKGGDDEVEVRDIAIQDDLKILTGDGQDWIMLDNVYVEDDLLISAGGLADEVVLFDLLVDGDAEVKTGKGDDEALADDVLFLDSATIRGGKGDDDVVILFCWFEDDAEISVGDGDDVLEIDDGTTFLDEVDLDGGDDDDLLILGHVNFWCSCWFFCCSDVDIDDFEHLVY
jgi:hypothetical protein